VIRFNALCLAAAALAQINIPGCPPSSTPPADTTPPQRGTIATTARASASYAQVGEVVTLLATATGDEAGGAVSYAWLQTAGHGVPIESPDSAAAAFVAPSLEFQQVLRFLVTTRNERGDVGQAAVEVTIGGDLNFGEDGSTGGTGGGSTTTGPTASAGADQFVQPGATVTLDGSGSIGSGLRFRWRQIAGDGVILASAEAALATLVAPAFVEDGTNRLEFELQVTDSRNRVATDRVVVKILGPDEPPPSQPVRVRVSTTLGDFTIELNAEQAPITVENFLQYVDDEFYDGTIFHRVIAGFVVQGGGFLPGLAEKETRDPIVNESDNGLSNVRGSVAMARTSDPDSATSQFYINLLDNTSLDARAGRPGYAVFGKVSSGMDAVDEIAGVQTESRGGFDDVPVTDVIILSIARINP
jgi:cyclophilin family peptidyl-prolyl cis-trans isomerase